MSTKLPTGMLADGVIKSVIAQGSNLVVTTTEGVVNKIDLAGAVGTSGLSIATWPTRAKPYDVFMAFISGGTPGAQFTIEETVGGSTATATGNFDGNGQFCQMAGIGGSGPITWKVSSGGVSVQKTCQVTVTLDSALYNTIQRYLTDKFSVTNEGTGVDLASRANEDIVIARLLQGTGINIVKEDTGDVKISAISTGGAVYGGSFKIVPVGGVVQSDGETMQGPITGYALKSLSNVIQSDPASLVWPAVPANPSVSITSYDHANMVRMEFNVTGVSGLGLWVFGPTGTNQLFTGANPVYIEGNHLDIDVQSAGGNSEVFPPIWYNFMVITHGPFPLSL